MLNVTIAVMLRISWFSNLIQWNLCSGRRPVKTACYNKAEIGFCEWMIVLEAAVTMSTIFTSTSSQFVLDRGGRRTSHPERFSSHTEPQRRRSHQDYLEHHHHPSHHHHHQQQQQQQKRPSVDQPSSRKSSGQSAHHQHHHQHKVAYVFLWGALFVCGHFTSA